MDEYISHKRSHYDPNPKLISAFIFVNILKSETMYFRYTCLSIFSPFLPLQKLKKELLPLKYDINLLFKLYSLFLIFVLKFITLTCILTRRIYSLYIAFQKLV